MKLLELINAINLDFSVIGVSKTWLQNSDCLVDIEGYNFVHNFRTDKTGGGVGIYIRKVFTYKVRRDVSYFNTDIYESIFLEIERPSSANIIVGNIYRPPGTGISEFVNKLNEMTVKISREQKLCYLMGDFNIDL